jgi:thioredoxin reductase (NADPH)
MNSTDTPRIADRLIMYGHPSSSAAYELRDFLARSVVSYDFVDVTVDTAIPTDWSEHLPVCELPNGTVILDATVRAVAEHLGWISAPRAGEYDLSIYGAGPAGLSAAVYAASEGLRVVLVERHAVGGQAAWSSKIENYLGFPGGIAGADLAERARQQAVDFGAEILQLREGVKAVFREGRIVVDLADGSTLTAKSNICATGVEYRRLDLDGADEFLNAGLFYGAGLSEAMLCRNEHVIVIGGGNSAGQAALHLSSFAADVDLLIRGPKPAASMSHYLLERLQNTANVALRTNSAVSALDGDAGGLREATIINSATGASETIATSHMFVLIGGAPNTDWAADTPIVRDANGYLVTGPDLLTDGRPVDEWPLHRPPDLLETSVPGSYAVGDVRRGSTKRVASAVGEGAMAVHLVHRWLAERHT